MNRISLIFSAAAVLAMNACTQREVLYTESSWSTTEESSWGGQSQTGEVKKKKGLFGKEEEREKRRIEEIFDDAMDAQKTLSRRLEGEEIEGDVKRPSYSDHRFDSGQFNGSRSFNQRDKKNGSQNEQFLGKKNYERKAFANGNRDAARESGFLSREQGSRSDFTGKFQAERWSSAHLAHERKSNPNTGKMMPFFGNRGAREGDVAVTEAMGVKAPNAPHREALMTVDEVRKMLHPNQFDES